MKTALLALVLGLICCDPADFGGTKTARYPSQECDAACPNVEIPIGYTLDERCSAAEGVAPDGAEVCRYTNCEQLRTCPNSSRCPEGSPHLTSCVCTTDGTGLAAIPAGVVAACSGAADGGSPHGPGLTVGRLEGGEYTNEHPEVGYLTVGCTATLIGKRIILAAGHCFGWESTLESPRGSPIAMFEMRSADGSRSARYGVVRVTNLDAYGVFNQHDVAIAELEACADDFAPPAPVAAKRPTEALPAVQFGYGCRSREPWCKAGAKPFLDGQKQKATFNWGEGKSSCPGDSGGPIFVSEEIAGVSSGAYPCGEYPDVYGNPVPFKLQIELAGGLPCSGWQEAEGTISVHDPLPGTNAPKEVSFRISPTLTVRLFGGYAGELEFLAGERVELRHVGDRVAVPVGYRLKGHKALAGIVKLQDDGTVWLQGATRKIFLAPGTPARIVDGLKGIRGKRVMVKGALTHTLMTIGGTTETVAMITATDARQAWGAY